MFPGVGGLGPVGREPGLLPAGLGAGHVLHDAAGRKVSGRKEGNSHDFHSYSSILDAKMC